MSEESVKPTAVVVQQKVIEPKELPIQIRRAGIDDVNFIFNSWIKSFRESYFVHSISNTIYFENQHKLMRKLVKTSEVLVACNPQDSSQLYGYVVCERIDGVFVLHFCYVKEIYRRMKIATALINAVDHDQETPGCYTHLTRASQKFCSKFNLVYHPYILFDLSDEVEVEA